MPRRLKPEHQLELQALYRVAAVIAEWYDELAGAQPEANMAAALRHAYDAGDLRGLRMAYNDLVEMTRATNGAQRRHLDERLRGQANTSLDAIDAKTAQRIDRLRTCGKLTSEEQYYLVREHVEFLAGTPGKETEVEQLWAMLQEFEERAAARARRRPSARPDDRSA